MSQQTAIKFDSRENRIQIRILRKRLSELESQSATPATSKEIAHIKAMLAVIGVAN